MLACEFIRQTIGDEPDAEGVKWVEDSFVKPQRTATAVVVACGVAAIACIVLATYVPALSVPTTIAVYAAIAGAVVCMVRIYKLRNSFARTMPAVMDQDVDPLAFGRRYLAYVKSQKSKDILGVCWNYARALRWQGRRGDAEKLMAAYSARFGEKRMAEKVLVHATYAYCAFDAQDLGRMREQIAFFDGLKERGQTQMMAATIEQLRGYAATLEAMGDPATRDAAHATLEGYYENGTPLQKVHFAYMLAQCSDRKNDRSRWITYASGHAGTTWVGKAARALR